jgi:hypothetical protein
VAPVAALAAPAHAVGSTNPLTLSICDSKVDSNNVAWGRCIYGTGELRVVIKCDRIIGTTHWVYGNWTTSSPTYTTWAICGAFDFDKPLEHHLEYRNE